MQVISFTHGEKDRENATCSLTNDSHDVNIPGDSNECDANDNDHDDSDCDDDDDDGSGVDSDGKDEKDDDAVLVAAWWCTAAATAPVGADSNDTGCNSCSSQ